MAAARLAANNQEPACEYVVYGSKKQCLALLGSLDLLVISLKRDCQNAQARTRIFLLEHGIVDDLHSVQVWPQSVIDGIRWAGLGPYSAQFCPLSQW